MTAFAVATIRFGRHVGLRGVHRFDIDEGFAQKRERSGEKRVVATGDGRASSTTVPDETIVDGLPVIEMEEIE